MIRTAHIIQFFHAGLFSRYKIIFVIFTYALIVISAFPQQSISTKTQKTGYKQYLQQAEVHLQSNRNEEAIKKMLKASDILERDNNKKELTLVYILIADTYDNLLAFDNAVDFYLKALETDAFPNASKKTLVHEKTGDIYVKSGNYTESLTQYCTVANNYKTKKDIENLTRILIKISSVHRRMGSFNESVKINQELKLLAIENDDQQLLFTAFNNLGYDFVQLKEYERAYECFQKASAAGKNNTRLNEWIQVEINAAVCLYNMKQMRRATDVLNMLLEQYEEDLNYSTKTRVQNILSLIYLNSDDLYNANLMSKSALMSAQKSGDSYLLQSSYHIYSRILKAGNDPIKALEYYEKYLSIRDSLLLEEKVLEQESARKKFEIEKYEKEIRLEIADENILEMKLRQYELEQARQKQRYDSLQQDTRLKSLQYESDRQATALELETLRKNQALQVSDRLRTDSIIQDQEIQIQHVKEQRRIREINRLEKEKKQEQMVKRRAIIIAILLVLVVAGVLSGLLVVRKKNTLLARQKKEIVEKNDHLEQLNEEITTQKQLIEEKNTSITDSIIYAEKIQSAVLPPEDFFNDHLKDYFILFKPRDIVSGDFYWGAVRKEKIIVVAADCTGHGVPGAFMSMLGTAFLNEIVSDTKENGSGMILDKLRINVIEALRQREDKSEARDGMDIALCIIDYQAGILKYSGAYNPLYYFHNGGFNEYKADRMPIGIHQNMNEHFTQQEIKMSSGDCFYIFSDGYVDQFGGPEGKKFKSKSFRELIADIHKKPMSEQKKILENTIEKWKGHSEQIDDILVMGVRL